MPKDGSKTRLKILDETTKLVFDNGFSGTTIDHILERTNVTKGTFFYHFKNKADLARSLMKHFSDSDMKMLEDVMAGATEASTDPKEQLLAFVQIFIDYFDKLEKPYAGCLYASFIYEPEQFEDDVKRMVADSLLQWRYELAKIMEKALAHHKGDVDIDSLADMFSVILEGAFITAKALKDAKLTAKQLLHYKRYLELLM